MKFTTPLLLVSLAANLGLAAYVYRSPASAPDALSRKSDGSVRSARPVSSTSQPPSEAARAALVSGDVAALEAAGFSPEVARELALGRAFARFAERLRSARSATSDDPRWWRNRPAAAANRESELLARRELSEALLAVFGDDFGFGGGDNRQFAFLSADKRAALRRITQDYDEMIARYSAAGGPQLASDREKLQLLRAERQRDIAALLSPAELAEYEMRTSNSAATLRNRFGDAIATEDDFRKLYALQKAFDDKYPMQSGRVTPETMRERAAAQRQLQADMRTALGNEAYAALMRASDSDLRTIDSLVSRLNLPTGTVDRLAAERENYAAESQRIANDSALTMPQRRTQLQELSSRAKASLAATLGSEGADAYAQRSPWLNMLQNGVAFSTNPQDAPMGGIPGGPSVVPVMPAGGPVAGQRQVINLSGGPDPAAGGAVAADSATFFYSAPVSAPIMDKIVMFDAVAIEGKPVIVPGPGGATVATPSGTLIVTPPGTTTGPTQPATAPNK